MDNLKNNLFSKETLDSIAMSKLCGGATDSSCSGGSSSDTVCIIVNCGCDDPPDGDCIPPVISPNGDYCWTDNYCPFDEKCGWT